MLSDDGTSGHNNRAIDAGETVSLRIPLENVSVESFRSTSGFIKTSDPYIRADVSEMIYSGRRVAGGQTTTFGPNTVVTPKEAFVFTISPQCPDGHTAEFSLVISDSDRRGRDFSIPFSLKIFNVGPLGFGKALVDDDIPGLSDGDADGIMEIGETIEYVLQLANTGQVAVEQIEVKLFVDHPKVSFLPECNTLRYRPIKGDGDRSVPASFVFEVGGSDSDYSEQLLFKMIANGQARGYHYSWLTTRLHQVGLKQARIAELATAKLRKISQLKAWSWPEIKALVSQGGNINALRTRRGYTALHFAAQQGYADDIADLVEQGANVDASFYHFPSTTPLVCALQKGQLEAAKALIAAGADVNSRGPWSPGIDDIPVMHFAAAEGFKEIVQLMIKHDAKVDAKTHEFLDRGDTALCVAAQAGKPGVVKLLLEAGANPNHVSKDATFHKTPLVLASRWGREATGQEEINGYVEVVRLLIEAKADVNFKFVSHHDADGSIIHTSLSATRGTFYGQSGELYKPKPFTGAGKLVYDLLRRAGAE
jgi:ankyrin repeat protein